MHLMYFTEQPMSAYPEEEGATSERPPSCSRTSTSTRRPAAGSTTNTSSTTRLAENVGFDGIMLNEHHNAPFCMQAKCNIFAVDPGRHDEAREDRAARQSAAARRQPVRLAEELGDDRHGLARAPRVRLRARRRSGAARHRRQSGLQPRALRGGARPDRQGVDAARTVPLGGHALPAPRGQPVGGAAPEAAPARLDSGRAQQGNDHLGGEEALSRTSRSAPPSRRPRRSGSSTIRSPTETGYAGGPEYRGYLQRCHVAETEEKALANARQFMWMQGEFTGLAHPVWSTPSGYFSPTVRTAFVEYAVGRRSNPRGASFEDQINSQMIVAGTPKTVIPKLRRLLEETRPSILGFWAADGFVSERGYPDVHPAARGRSAARAPRDRQGVGPVESLRSQRARRHRVS